MNELDVTTDSKIVSNSESNSYPSNSQDNSVAFKKTQKCTHPGCTATFLRPSRLLRHVRQHTGERPYKCDYEGCDKAYTNNLHLKRHRQSHNSIKPTFKCTKCSLLISNQHNLKRHHERVHADNHKFSCKECGLKFNKEQKYKEHEAAHSGVGIYKCKICSRQYIHLSGLRKHERSHENKKEYPCTASDCTAVFNKWSLLSKHKKSTHATEYKCNDCDKVFLIKTHLKLHSVVHVNDRTVLPCPYDKCPRFYFFKRNLEHHIRSNHLGQKYQCDICKLKVSSKQKISEHIQKIHLSNKKRKTQSKSKRRKRKDAGAVRKSMLTKLTGLDLPHDIEKVLLNRKTEIQDSLDDAIQVIVNPIENGTGEKIKKEVPTLANGSKTCNENEKTKESCYEVKKEQLESCLT